MTSQALAQINYNLFIQAGADVNFIDSAGVACVMVAAEYGLPGIMKCLLDAGANPNIPDEVSLILFPPPLPS